MKKKIKAKLNNFELFFLHPIQIGQTKQKKKQKLKRNQRNLLYMYVDLII